MMMLAMEPICPAFHRAKKQTSTNALLLDAQESRMESAAASISQPRRNPFPEAISR